MDLKKSNDQILRIVLKIKKNMHVHNLEDNAPVPKHVPMYINSPE